MEGREALILSQLQFAKNPRLFIQDMDVISLLKFCLIVLLSTVISITFQLYNVAQPDTVVSSDV